MDEVKPFDIPKREVWEAFKKVKANQGAAGVDGQSIADFEADLTNNLYELWNRLSSGSYSLGAPQIQMAASQNQGARVSALCVRHVDGEKVSSHFPPPVRRVDIPKMDGGTRGQVDCVVLVGQKKAVAIAVRNVSGRTRWSKLREWLSADVSKRDANA